MTDEEAEAIVDRLSHKTKIQSETLDIPSIKELIDEILEELVENDALISKVLPRLKRLNHKINDFGLDVIVQNAINGKDITAVYKSDGHTYSYRYFYRWAEAGSIIVWYEENGSSFDMVSFTREFFKTDNGYYRSAHMLLEYNVHEWEAKIDSEGYISVDFSRETPTGNFECRLLEATLVNQSVKVNRVVKTIWDFRIKWLYDRFKKSIIDKLVEIDNSYLYEKKEDVGGIKGRNVFINTHAEVIDIGGQNNSFNIKNNETPFEQIVQLINDLNNTKQNVFDPDCLIEANEEIQRLRNELQKSGTARPKILRAGLTTLNSFLASIAANEWGSRIVQLLQKI